MHRPICAFRRFDKQISIAALVSYDKLLEMIAVFNNHDKIIDSDHCLFQIVNFQLKSSHHKGDMRIF